MENREKIYKNFIREFEEVKSFYNLTKNAYNLSVIMLDDKKECKDISHDLITENTEVSYTPADVKIENIKQINEWIPLKDYAEKSKCAYADIKRQAENGLLGQVLVENDRKYVIWPPEQQSNSDLPKDCKKKSFKVTLSQEVHASIPVDEKSFLDIMGMYTYEIDKQTQKSNLLLNKETLLLYWAIFETFIKEYINILIQEYPEIVFNSDKYSKKVITFSELFNSSDGLTNIESLKDNMISNIIRERTEEEREPIGKMLVFIKECFKSQNKDPFEAWYVFKKIKMTATYDDINQIRIIRNGLIHNNGKLSEREWGKLSLINRPENGIIIIDNDLLEKIYLILKSSVYSLIGYCLKRICFD